MHIQLQSTFIQPAIYEACHILNKLYAAGFTAYIVGGAVRDSLLNKVISDVDIATSAKPEQVMHVFSHCIPTGLQHGTVTVIENGQSYEVTTYRAESIYEDHRRPSEIEFVHEIEADLLRRDFTMNAMALSTDLIVLDPFHGYADIQSQLLRCVGHSEERFNEDALRMLRALRFCITYKLGPSLSLWRALKQKKQSLRYIAMERVSYELSRMLATDQLNRALQLLIRSDLLYETKEQLHLPTYYYPTMLSQVDLNNIEHELCKWTVLYLAADVPTELAVQDLRALKLSNNNRSTIIHLIELYRLVRNWDFLQNNEWKGAWINQLNNFSMHTIELLLEEILVALDKKLATKLQDLHVSLIITSSKQLSIRGHDLIKWSNRSSGPWVKEKLANIMVKVALGELANEKHIIEAYYMETLGGV